MTEGIESITVQALSAALDAASLRQQVLATNIANVNTPGYVAQRIDFEEQLESARRLVDSQGSADAFSLENAQMRIRPNLDAQGRPSSVKLDMEMADVARNAIHYQALVKGLSKHYAILSSAVSDGKK